MNFKKFISGVSALTIAASAFAGMAVTANAADLYSVSTWTETEMNNWSSTGTLALDETNNRIWFNPTKPSSAYAASKSVTVTENAVVTYDVDWYFGSATNRANNYEYIQFGDTLRFGWNSNYKVYVSTDAGANYGTDSIFNGGNSTYTKHIKIVYDSATKKITAAQFGGSDVTSLIGTTIPNFTAGSIAFGFQRGGSTANWGYPNGIGAVTISEEVQTVSTADYTVNYLLNDTPVKSVTETGVVGNAPEFSSTTIVGDDNVTYIYVSDNAEGVTIASDGTTVVNVTVREPYTYTASLTSSIDNSVIASQEGVSELATATLYHNRYIVKDGDAYKATKPADNRSGYDTTLSYANQTAEITYEKAISGIVYFAEAEDLGWNGVDDTARMSGGKGGYPTGESVITNLNPGKYVVYVGHRGNDGTSFTVKAGTTPVLEDVEVHGYWLEAISDEFELSAATDISVSVKNGGNSKGIDYILITKTGDYVAPVAPSANLVAADWTADAATGYEASGNVLSDAKGNSVYGYKATLEGNGIEYNTVKVYVKVADGEADNEKPYTDTKFGGNGYATFYVISDTALDTGASRVYCE